MTDLIDRQVAIDAIDRERKNKHLFNTAEDGLLEARGVINTLPSAQPEIIRCKDCTYQVESWSGMKYCEAHGDHIGKDYDYCSNARRKTNGIL